MRVALATCAVKPEPDPDERLMLEALRAAGVDAHTLAWDAPETDPGAFDLVVLRSTWNYPCNPEAFRAWLRDAAARTTLLNPLDIVLANLHKGYLRALESRGTPIIPTRWVEQGEPAPLREIINGAGWGRFVIKPAVSAGSYLTRAFDADEADAAQAFLDELARERDVMIQAYMHAIHEHGERCLIWIGGVWTHAIRKEPRFDDADENVSAALELTDAERAFAEPIIADLAQRLLYARVDVIQDDDGALRLAELELIEPSLYFLQHPPALARFVEGITRRVAFLARH